MELKLRVCAEKLDDKTLTTTQVTQTEGKHYDTGALGLSQWLLSCTKLCSRNVNMRISRLFASSLKETHCFALLWWYPALSSVGCNYIGLPSSSSSQTGPLNPGTHTTIIRIYLPHCSRSRSPDSFGQDTPITSPEKILLSFSFKLVSQKVCQLIRDMISLTGLRILQEEHFWFCSSTRHVTQFENTF